MTNDQLLSETCCQLCCPTDYSLENINVFQPLTNCSPQLLSQSYSLCTVSATRRTCPNRQYNSQFTVFPSFSPSISLPASLFSSLRGAVCLSLTSDIDASPKHKDSFITVTVTVNRLGKR